MLMQTVGGARVPYVTRASATAIANPHEHGGYRTPSGAHLGGLKQSLGAANAQSERDGLLRYRAGPGVRSDYQLHEKGRLLGEAEALGSFGAGDGMLTAREPTEAEKQHLAMVQGCQDAHGYSPVMGSNMVLYGNACEAEGNGQTVLYDTEELRRREAQGQATASGPASGTVTWDEAAPTGAPPAAVQWGTLALLAALFVAMRRGM